MCWAMVLLAVAVYVWAAACVLALHYFLCQECERWVGRPMPVDLTFGKMAVTCLCLWWLTPVLFLIARGDKSDTLLLIARSNYKRWLAVQLADDLARDGREAAEAEARGRATGPVPRTTNIAEG